MGWHYILLTVIQWRYFLGFISLSPAKCCIMVSLCSSWIIFNLLVRRFSRKNYAIAFEWFDFFFGNFLFDRYFMLIWILNRLKSIYISWWSKPGAKIMKFHKSLTIQNRHWTSSIIHIQFRLFILGHQTIIPRSIIEISYARRYMMLIFN